MSRIMPLNHRLPLTHTPFESLYHDNHITHTITGPHTFLCVQDIENATTRRLVQSLGSSKKKEYALFLLSVKSVGGSPRGTSASLFGLNPQQTYGVLSKLELLPPEALWSKLQGQIDAYDDTVSETVEGSLQATAYKVGFDSVEAGLILAKSFR
jgi:hypothetical protein